MLRTSPPLIGALGVTMSEQPDILAILADPLSSVSRAERRNLIASSFVVGLISLTRSFPTHVSSLGIEISTASQRYFIWASMAVVVYFTVAFLIYAMADYMRARHLRHEYDKGAHIDGENWSYEDQFHYDEIKVVIGNIDWVYERTEQFLSLRMFFEFIFPLLCSVVSLVIAGGALRDT